MKIELIFDSDEEKARILSVISQTMQNPSTDFAIVNQAAVKFLEEMFKGAYVQGRLKQVQVEQEKPLASEAGELFKR